MLSTQEPSISLYTDLFSTVRQSVLSEICHHMTHKRCSNQLVVDIGGGEGDTVAILKEKFPNNQYWLVEPSLNYCKAASLKKKRADKIFNIRAEDFVEQCNEKLDFILCQEMIHHIKEPFVFFKKVRAILKPHGVLFVITRPLITEFPFGPHGERTWRHSYAASPAELVSMIKEVGLSVTQQLRSYSVKVKKQDWLDMMAFHPIFSNIAFHQLSDAERQEDCAVIQKMNDPLVFMDHLIFLMCTNSL